MAALKPAAPEVSARDIQQKTMLEQTMFSASLFADEVFILTNQQISSQAQDILKEPGVASPQVIVEPDGADSVRLSST